MIKGRPCKCLDMLYKADLVCLGSIRLHGTPLFEHSYCRHTGIYRPRTISTTSETPTCAIMLTNRETSVNACSQLSIAMAGVKESGLDHAQLRCVEVSTSKTGKHGHAKAHIVAIDIFTGAGAKGSKCGLTEDSPNPYMGGDRWPALTNPRDQDKRSQLGLGLVNVAALGKKMEDLCPTSHNLDVPFVGPSIWSICGGVTVALAPRC